VEVLAHFRHSQPIDKLKCIGGNLKKHDGEIYKNKRGEKVMYVSHHDMYYTLNEMTTGHIWNYTCVKRVTRGGSANKLLILDPVTHETMMEPDPQFVHPLHIFRVPGRSDAECVYRIGGKRKFGSLALTPEYHKLLEQAHTNSNRKSCAKHPKARVTIQYSHQRNKYYLNNCNECDSARMAAQNRSLIQTVPGKAKRLAMHAIYNQNRRHDQHKNVMSLEYTVHQPMLERIFERLIRGLLALPAANAMDLQPNNLTNDKLDDTKGYIEKKGTTYDCTNTSVTININNPSKPVDAATKQTLCLHSTQLRHGTPFSSTLTPEYKTALWVVKDRLTVKSSGIYTNKLAAHIASALKNVCGHAKASQKQRRVKRPTMRIIDDVTQLKLWVIDLYFKCNGRCHISQLPLCFCGTHGTQLSIDRLDNAIGYEETNISLVADLFQAELSQTKGEGIVNLKWTPELFREHGDKVFGNELVFRYTDIAPEERAQIEAMCP